MHSLLQPDRRRLNIFPLNVKKNSGKGVSNFFFQFTKFSLGSEVQTSSVDQPHNKVSHSIIWKLCEDHSVRPPRPIHRPIKARTSRRLKCGGGAPYALRALIHKFLTEDHSAARHYPAHPYIIYYPLTVYHGTFAVLQVLTIELQLFHSLYQPKL